MLNKINSIAVLWSASPRDWVHIDEEYIYNWFLENVRDGDIVLLHDTKDATVPAVLRAIDTLTEQGFEFVRADELLCRNGDKLAPALPTASALTAAAHGIYRYMKKDCRSVLQSFFSVSKSL